MIGATLKEKRAQSGTDLRQIADTLRIRYEYLQALEESNYEKLPPEVYTRGYIREYAKFLGLDPDPLLVTYTEENAPQEAVTAGTQSPPKRGRGALVMVSLSVAAVVLILVSLGIIVPRQGERLGEQPVPPAVPREVNVEPVPAPSPEPEQIGSSVQSPETYTVRVVASEATWLRIAFPHGESEEVLLKPGESKEWAPAKELDLKIGNAGGIRLFVNGKDLGAPGEQGRVITLRIPTQETTPTAPMTGDTPR